MNNKSPINTGSNNEPLVINWANVKTMGTTSALLHMGRGALCAEFTPSFERGNATYRSVLTKASGERYVISDYVRKGIERSFPLSFK